MIGFVYPASPHVRKHGPAGYKDYSSYRDWLRDEFTFRCVYCLHREQWEYRGGSFHVEHSVPSSVDPGKRCDYSNLLYACGSCNEAKQALVGLPNPCDVGFGDCLRILADGKIEALSADGEKLKQVLRLGSEKTVAGRSRWMRILEAVCTSEPGLYEELMGFPKDLPDLRSTKVPENSKPEGAINCYFTFRERGELEAFYRAAQLHPGSGGWLGPNTSQSPK